MPFDETHWSLVMKAGAQGDGAQEAMASLYQSYWPPLYSFLRARGYSKDDASDLLQGFFLVSIEKNYIQVASPEAGRFRTFLLTALIRYVSNNTAKNHAQKRGGGIVHVRIDADDAESMHARIPSSMRSPEEVFERQWAMGILDRALDDLGRDYRESGRGPLFEALRPFLAVTGADSDYEQMAERLGMTLGALRVATHRLRERYRKAITAIVAETVATPEDVDDELRYLINALSTVPRGEQ